MGRYHGPRPTRSACVQHGAGAVGGHLAARLAAHGSAAGIEVAAVACGVQLEAKQAMPTPINPASLGVIPE